MADIIRSFDNIEEMFEALRRDNEAAMARLDDAQRELVAKRAFHFLRPYPEMGIWIFGEVDLDASIELERTLTPPEEMGWFPEWRAEFEERNTTTGLKFSKCYSVIETEGELGSTHVVTMFEITAEAFEEARKVDWQLPGRIAECPTLHAELLVHAARQDT